VEPIKGTPPVSVVCPKRNAAVSNLRTRLTKVRGYLAKSTSAHMRGEWESRITTYELQLEKVIARARVVRS